MFIDIRARKGGVYSDPELIRERPALLTLPLLSKSPHQRGQNTEVPFTARAGKARRGSQGGGDTPTTWKTTNLKQFLAQDLWARIPAWGREGKKGDISRLSLKEKKIYVRAFFLDEHSLESDPEGLKGGETSLLLSFERSATLHKEGGGASRDTFGQERPSLTKGGGSTTVRERGGEA